MQFLATTRAEVQKDGCPYCGHTNIEYLPISEKLDIGKCISCEDTFVIRKNKTTTIHRIQMLRGGEFVRPVPVEQTPPQREHSKRPLVRTGRLGSER
jgi:hypothetical protein